MSQNPPCQKTGKCENCGIFTRWILHRQFLQSGAETFIWQCSKCNQRNPDRTCHFIKKETVREHLTEAQIEALPIIMPDASNRCVKCGKRTAELHHWAPKAIFGQDEAEQWPKDYLCVECHKEWHEKINRRKGEAA